MKQLNINILRQALILSACLLSFFCTAQQNFDTLYHINYYTELPYSVHQTQDSGYIYITSGDDYSTNTYWMECNKLNTDGSVNFQKIFGFVGAQCYVGFSGSLKQTVDGGWVFGGGFASTFDKGRGMAVKYNAVGDTQFVKLFGDTSTHTFYDCIQTSDSGFVFIGIHTKYSPTINNDFWIVKTDSSGNLLWERTYGASVDEQAYHVIENSKHQLLISGSQADINFWHHPFVVIYDLFGNLIATKAFTQGAMNSGGAGNLYKYGATDYLLGAALDTVINNTDAVNPFYVARLDSSLNIKWRNIYNSPEWKEFFLPKEVSDGGIVIVGNKNDSTLAGNPIAWIAKMDSSGNKLWEHFYMRSRDYSYFTDFQETYDHGFIVCGTAWDSIHLNQDSWIVKLDSNGCLDGSCGVNTGVFELILNTPLKVYPNPTSNSFTILTNELTGQLILSDLLGHEIIKQSSSHQKEVDMDVSNLSVGVYLVQFISGNKLFAAKIVKQ